jgi:hypothetical protein
LDGDSIVRIDHSSSNQNIIIAMVAIMIIIQITKFLKKKWKKEENEKKICNKYI